MDIITAYLYLSKGYRIRRPEWARSFHIKPDVYYANMRIEDVLANDWEIIFEGIIDNGKITYKDQK